MATISRQHAVDRLTAAIQDAGPDDLVEVYEELFPQDTVAGDAASREAAALSAKVLAHVHAGLEDEEILDLWSLVFPGNHTVRFDEDDDLIHYAEQVEHAGQVD